MKKTISHMLAGVIMAGMAGAMGTQSTALAGSLETMERERAQLIKTMLDPNLSPQARHEQLVDVKHRLADMERRVLRDDSLIGKDNQHVRRAFENYDLTFLVHAAAENQRAVIDQWMNHMGLNTHNIMSATIRRR